MTLQVEFEREVPGPLFTEDESDAVAKRAAQALGPTGRFFRRVQTVRWVAMFVGAGLIAVISHLSGLGMGGALCLFFGLLPVLWVSGWGVALLVGVRGVRDVAGELDLGARMTRSVANRRVQKVRLQLGEHGIDARLDEQEVQFRWNTVRLDRHAPDLLVIGAEDQYFEVRRSAFADEVAFETFAHAVQAGVWKALPR